MSAKVNLDKGNKRRVRQIRWKRSELVSAALLLLAVAIVIVCLALWIRTHSFDEGCASNGRYRWILAHGFLLLTRGKQTR